MKPEIAPSWTPVQQAAAITLSVALAACGVGGLTPGGYERLKAQPEATLIYPDSELLADGGYDAEMTMDGPQPAALWKILGTGATIEDVLAFYETDLREAGWEPTGSSRTTTEIESWRWLRGDLSFRLGHKDTEEWYEILPGSERYPTLYEIRLEERLEHDSD